MGDRFMLVQRYMVPYVHFGVDLLSRMFGGLKGLLMARCLDEMRCIGV